MWTNETRKTTSNTGSVSQLRANFFMLKILYIIWNRSDKKIIIITENDSVRRRHWCDSVHKQSTYAHAHTLADERSRAHRCRFGHLPTSSWLCVACPSPPSAHSTSTHCIPPRRIPLNARAGRRRRRLTRCAAASLSPAAAAARLYYIHTLRVRARM